MPLSPQTKKLLEKFALLANWSVPGNPPDIERFWDFVVCAYRNKEHDISLDEFLDIINTQTKDGGQDLKTKKRELSSKMLMFSKYEDGIKLLRRFERKET